MHYKITIFGACAPYPRLIYWIVSSISQGKKDDMSSKSWYYYYYLNPGQKKRHSTNYVSRPTVRGAVSPTRSH